MAARASASDGRTPTLIAWPQRLEVGEPVCRPCAPRAPLRADRRPAGNRTTCRRARRRRDEKPLLDRAIDDRQHLQALGAVVVVDRNRVIGEPAGGRAVVQPALGDLLSESLLDGGAVQHRLQRAAAADDQVAASPGSCRSCDR